MGYNLTNEQINLTFQQLTQISGSVLVDGTGSAIPSLDITVTSASFANNATSASYAVTASHLTGTITSASHAVNADNSISSSYAAVAGTATSSTTSQYSDNTVVNGKNLSGAEILKGTPLYFTGSGTGGNLVGVYPADASNPSRMPAAGVAGETLAIGAEGVVLLDGFLSGVATVGFNSGDAVYVAVGGGYTNVRPTGSANLVQSIGYIEKVHPSNGSGVIRGSGRANDIPNMPIGEVFVGNTAGTYTTVSTGSLSVASAVTATSASHAVNADTAISSSYVTGQEDFAKTNVNNSFSGNQTFNDITVNGTGSFAYIQSVTGSAKIIGDAFVVVNNDTPAERYAGLSVYDSGSANTTASLYFDGLLNDWNYEYTSGSQTDYGVALFGPEYSTKGTPTYNTVNTLVKSDGGHHLIDSSIVDAGGLVVVNSELTVSGSVRFEPANGLNLQEFPGSTPSYIRFRSGSNPNDASYINIQNEPGGNGRVTISSFPNNDHFVFFDPGTYRTYFESIIEGGQNGGPLQIGAGANVTGSLANTVTGAERFRIYGDNGVVTSAGGALDVSPNSSTLSVGFQSGFGTAVYTANSATGDDFGFSGDMNQWGYLGDWTGPGIYANNPAGQYPTIVGFQNKASWTDGRVTFLTPISASAGITSGDATVNGDLAVTMAAPGSNSAKNIFTFTGANVDGVAYNNASINLQDFNSYGDAYKDAIFMEVWNSSNYDFGAGFGVSGKVAQLEVKPSGSGAFDYSTAGLVKLADNYNNTTTATLYASDVNIGRSTHTTTLDLEAQSINLSGSVDNSAGRSTAHVDAITVVGAGTSTMDCSTGNFFTVALNASTTLTATNITAGQTISVRVANSGANTMAFDTMFRFAGGTAPTITPSGIDVLTFISFDGTNLESTAVQNLS